jgi:radical SAM protein with 4Fe4S-binding SPASM domain
VKGLKYLVWLCTRAYEKKAAYSLGDGRPNPNELGTHEAKAFLKKAADFDVENFFITGENGEPFLRKDMLEIIGFASELGFKPYIKTDGWNIDQNVVKYLASCNCQVIVSIAGPQNVDEMLRGKGAYESSIDAAKLCAKEGILTSLSVKNTKYVVNEIQNLVRLAQDIGSKGFSLADLIPQPVCVNEQISKLGPLEPSPDEHEKELNEIYTLSKEKGNSISLLAYDIFYNRIRAQHEPDLKLKSRCSVCHNLESNEWLEVLDDGKTYGCSPLGLVFGDVRTDSFEEIMNRIRRSETVKRMADHSNLKGKCGTCEYNGICGGCRARAHLYSGDMFAEDPLCPYIPRSLRNSR